MIIFIFSGLVEYVFNYSHNNVTVIDNDVVGDDTYFNLLETAKNDSDELVVKYMDGE